VTVQTQKGVQCIEHPLQVGDACHPLNFRGRFRVPCWRDKGPDRPLYLEYRTIYSLLLEIASLKANWPLSGIHQRRTAIIHRTVRCAPDCPVSQRSAGPTVGRAICVGHVAEPTARRGHRTVRCALDMSGAPTALWLPTVDFAEKGKKSGTGQCPVCTGLSGAPRDRRQDLPSWNALNGS
jgi:hypothetical protein